jgi:hypothetical protein
MNNVTIMGHTHKVVNEKTTFFNVHQGKSVKVGDENRNVVRRPCVGHRREIRTPNAQKRVAGNGALHPCINSERHAARFDITFPLSRHEQT